MDFDPRDLAILVLTVLLAMAAFRLWLGTREVAVIQDTDYVDSLPRTFVRVCLRQGEISPYLADADTGRPLQFVGCRNVIVQGALQGTGKRANMLVALEGVRVEYPHEVIHAAK